MEGVYIAKGGEAEEQGQGIGLLRPGSQQAPGADKSPARRIPSPVASCDWIFTNSQASIKNLWISKYLL